MKVVHKSVADLYPDAEIIFEYNEFDEFLKFFEYFGFVVLITAILFFFIHIVHNFLWSFIIIILWSIWAFWDEYLVSTVYKYNNFLILGIFKKWSVIIPVEEISYILLRGYKYENNQLHSLKWGLHSSHPGIIIQAGLFRFILRYTNIDLFVKYDISLTRLFENFIVKVNLNEKIMNNYDIVLNWKHKKIEAELHFKRIVEMIKYITTKPVIYLYNIIVKK
ncbi:MAG: hypothetical protein WCO98_04250 [bacterium]